MFCSSCGKQNPDNSSFCSSCGAPVSVPRPAPSSIVDLQKPQEPAPTQRIQRQAVPSTDKPAYVPPPANALNAGVQTDSKTKIFNVIAILVAVCGLCFALYYLLTNTLTLFRLFSVVKVRLEHADRFPDRKSEMINHLLIKSGLVTTIITFAFRVLVSLASVIAFGTVFIGKGVKASVIVPVFTILTSIAYIISFEFFYSDEKAQLYHSSYYARFTGHLICITEFAAVIGALVLIIYIFSKSKIAGGIAAFINSGALLVTFINFVRIVFKLVSWAGDKYQAPSSLGGKPKPVKYPATAMSAFNYFYGFFLSHDLKGWTYNTLLMKLNLAGKDLAHSLDLVGFGAMFCVTGTLFALSIALLCSKGMAKKKTVKDHTGASSV